MTWNWRVLHDGFEHYWIGEVYYDEYGKMTAYSGPVPLDYETLVELREDLGRMTEALNKPIVEAW